MNGVWNGVFIGGAGGFVAGVTVWLVQRAHVWFNDWRHKWRLGNWLQNNTENRPGKEFRSTRAIASWNNLTEDRVRYICSLHKKIYLSTGETEDMWSIYELKSRSVKGNRTQESVEK